MDKTMCDIYQQGMNAEAFADEVLKTYFKNEIPSFPIDPFKMMRDFGVVYQFMNLKKLEGIYLIPENNRVPLKRMLRDLQRPC